MEIKEEYIIKDSENLRLKERNDHMQQQIAMFKQEFDGIHDFINLKEDQIRNKFKDEEVWVSLQVLLKELISISKADELKWINIPDTFNKEDINKLIKSNYLSDSFVRYAIVNSVSYLQEWKESLNYLKQKYSEAELKYGNILPLLFSILLSFYLFNLHYFLNISIYSDIDKEFYLNLK